MAIKIIGELHRQPSDNEFMNQAKKLAKRGDIILVLENEVFDDHTNGCIEKNIYAIEDGIIRQYVRIINALSNIYSILRIAEVFTGDKSEWEIFNEVLYKGRHNYDLVTSSITKDVASKLIHYTEIYGKFLANSKGNNPILSAILKNLIDKVIKDDYFKLTSQNPLEQLLTAFSGEFSVTKEAIDLVNEHLKFFNQVFELAAKLIKDHVVQSRDNYSERVRFNEAFSEKWMSDYFEFKLIHPASKFSLDCRKLVIDLRNQLFVERLIAIASNFSNSDIWFIVGDNHLKGLQELFLEQYQHYKIRIIPRAEKDNLLIQQANIRKEKVVRGAYSSIFRTFNRKEETVSCEEMARSVFGRGSNTARILYKK